MKKCALESKKNVKLIQEDLNIEELDENSVCINVKAVTICGSDMRYFMCDELPYGLKYPLVLGHEVSGIVQRVGRNVKRLKVGDRVAVEPGNWCGSCCQCKKGNYHFCENMKFMASKGYCGALQEQIVWPEKCVFRLSDHMNFEMGALIEPLSVAYSAIEKIDFSQKKSVAILGAGSIGMLIGKLISIMVPNVTFKMIDIVPQKIKLGEQIGLRSENFIINQSFGQESNYSFDTIIDTTANSVLVERCIKMLLPEGDLVLVGVSDQKMCIDFSYLVNHGIKISASYRYKNTYPKLLKLFEQGSFGIENIITHRFKAEESQKAFETAAYDSNCLKVLIQI